MKNIKSILVISSILALTACGSKAVVKEENKPVEKAIAPLAMIEDCNIVIGDKVISQKDLKSVIFVKEENAFSGVDTNENKVSFGLRANRSINGIEEMVENFDKTRRVCLK